ncbi:hypothetical protein OIU81_02795 [Streptomyces sp. NBC_01454]|uniref:hypothetical protein n=1 Tax=Streptomyces sp. NBC_01454 TaxID=2975867 RepID=UPI002E304709|nr:hypothetical protein [Streptomyces sp. NBC_01454]
MTGSVQVIGVSELTGALSRLTASFNLATKSATAKAAHLTEGAIKEKLTTSSHRPGTPTPSAPGEPPSLVTGTLRRSIKVTGPHPLGMGRWEAQIGPTAVYGRVQELGGPTGRGGATELPARPYVAPAYERVIATGAVSAIYHQAWRAAIAR